MLSWPGARGAGKEGPLGWAGPGLVPSSQDAAGARSEPWRLTLGAEAGHRHSDAMDTRCGGHDSLPSTFLLHSLTGEPSS